MRAATVQLGCHTRWRPPNGMPARRNAAPLRAQWIVGLPSRNRTCDPQLRRLMLYPTELWAVWRDAKHIAQMTTGRQMNDSPSFELGRSTRIRTLDPLVPNQVRYRTAPHSEDSIILRALTGVKSCAGRKLLLRRRPCRQCGAPWLQRGLHLSLRPLRGSTVRCPRRE